MLAKPESKTKTIQEQEKNLLTGKLGKLAKAPKEGAEEEGTIWGTSQQVQSGCDTKWQDNIWFG